MKLGTSLTVIKMIRLKVDHIFSSFRVYSYSIALAFVAFVWFSTFRQTIQRCHNLELIKQKPWLKLLDRPTLPKSNRLKVNRVL